LLFLPKNSIYTSSNRKNHKNKNKIFIIVISIILVGYILLAKFMQHAVWTIAAVSRIKEEDRFMAGPAHAITALSPTNTATMPPAEEYEKQLALLLLGTRSVVSKT
jgi:hypothetical protein